MRNAFAVGLILLAAGTFAEPVDVVDEPLGARYSLGMTLWHLGHSARMIEQFQEYAEVLGHEPADLLPAERLQAPGELYSVLLEPELLSEKQRTGWGVKDDFLTSGAGDQGPSVSFPLSIPRAGLYRLWVQYYGWTNGTGVTRLRIYPKGKDHLAPILNDEIYDYAVGTEGLNWKDTLVDLEAGDYTVTLSHVTRWWHHGKGPRGYCRRWMDCLYLTEALWAEPPGVEDREAIRAAADPDGIQWTIQRRTSDEEAESWSRWQVRPASWEDRETSPELFYLSRRFWREQVDALAEIGYDEADVPDYREDVRQVIFDDRWNMVGNPVRIRRQIEVLQSDIRTEPTPHVYEWINAGEFDEVTGSWERKGTTLWATYSDFRGEAKHALKAPKDGEYTIWVRFRNINYHAPWRVTVSAPDGGTIQFDRDQQLYPKDGASRAAWQKIGALSVQAGDPMQFSIVPLRFKRPGTYRGIYSFLITTDADYVPDGSIRPAITTEQYVTRARSLGADPASGYMLWSPVDAYAPLSQVSWPTDLAQGPIKQVAGDGTERRIAMSADSTRGIAIHLRSLQADPISLSVNCGPLQGEAGTFDGKLTWRVIGFAPHGTHREHWSPFFLLRRPSVTVPPWSVAGVWLTVDSTGLPPGEYASTVTLAAEGLPEQTVQISVRVSPVRIAAKQPVLVGGWTAPPEGEEYMQDYADHGMNIWYRPMSKTDMQRWGIRLLALPVWKTTVEESRAYVERLKGMGLDYSDWIFTVRDEPHGKSEEDLKAYLDVAKAIREADPETRISFNPGEAGTLPTFEILDSYCDFWLPYTHHRTYHPKEAAAKRAIFTVKPWMWYTTPCLWDKSPGLPQQLYDQIRSVPYQPGRCQGTAFFAFYYPFRDPWDTSYEHLKDVGVTVLPSRHGPIATRTWEAIREGIQHANLAVMVRERLGAASWEDVTDEAAQTLIREGSVDELLAWLEAHP